jgi:hypothetical protein
MKDREFLIWLHTRLTDVHGEDPLVDYMHKLRALIKSTPRDSVTPNCGTGNSLKELQAALDTLGV